MLNYNILWSLDYIVSNWMQWLVSLKFSFVVGYIRKYILSQSFKKMNTFFLQHSFKSFDCVLPLFAAVSIQIF